MTYFKDGLHILQMKPFKGYQTNDPRIIDELNKVAITYDKRTIYYKCEMIKTLIKYNVEGNWVQRMCDSEKYGRDSSSLNSLMCRYGEDVGKMLFDEKLKKSTVTEEMYIQKYGDTIGKEKWKELCNSKGNFSEHHFTKRYGQNIGKQKWNEVLDKKLKTQKENFKNKKWKNGRTLEEYQTRYGIEDGYKRWKRRNDNHSYRFSREYYINEYGNDIGQIKYREYVDGLVRQVRKSGGYSKISQTLFDLIYDRLEDNFREICRYATRGGEERFFMENDKLIMVDFKCGNKIIEFDGDYWHRSDKAISADILKQNFLESKGYDVLRITENEYLNDRDRELNKCKNFINETT